MKLSLINESVDITGKLDPLIAKYVKLRDSAKNDYDEAIYQTTIEKLQRCKTDDIFKEYLNAMYKALVEEFGRIKKAIAKLDPDDLFSVDALKTSRHILDLTNSLHKDMVAYGRSIKII